MAFLRFSRFDFFLEIISEQPSVLIFSHILFDYIHFILFFALRYLHTLSIHLTRIHFVLSSLLPAIFRIRDQCWGLNWSLSHNFSQWRSGSQTFAWRRPLHCAQLASTRNSWSGRSAHRNRPRHLWQPRHFPSRRPNLGRKYLQKVGEKRLSSQLSLLKF